MFLQLWVACGEAENVRNLDLVVDRKNRSTYNKSISQSTEADQKIWRRKGIEAQRRDKISSRCMGGVYAADRGNRN